MDPFAYQTLFGGALFSAGLVYGWRIGAIGLSGRPLRNLGAMLGGLALFLLAQGWMQYAAPGYPHESHAYSGAHAPRRAYGAPIDYAIMAAYFVGIAAVGSSFAKHSRTTHDFFFGGRRFSWWLIAFSMVATTVGAYSFVKYSEIAFSYGLSSTQTYLNDWFWAPLALFGWLPILYFRRLASVPEYFERRFGKAARLTLTALLLVYLVGYVGVNLFTMGQALHLLLGWPVWTAALLAAGVSAIYVWRGGQTSVIVTDLLQGVLLLGTGLLLLALGVREVGGLDRFFALLPPEHRQAFPTGGDPAFPPAGIFWQDAIANSGMFYLINQGLVMRLLSARSAADARKATMVTMLVLMPVAAAVVASGGWVGRVLHSAGVLPPEVAPKAVFFWVANLLCRPGVFGLVLATLVAALMSTIDTLITAVSAIVVNDIWRPYLRPGRDDAHYLRVARWAAMAATAAGLLLVPIYGRFGTIYAAHGAFTAAVTPPMVVTVLCALLWPRFSARAAVATMIGGAVAVAASIVWPSLCAPFTHGVPAVDEAFHFTRALYGLCASGAIALAAGFVCAPAPPERVRGLIATSIVKWDDAVTARARARVAEPPAGAGPPDGESAVASLNAAAAAALGARGGDRVHVTTAGFSWGGLRSLQAVVGPALDDGGLDPRIAIVGGPDAAWAAPGREVRVERFG